MIIIKVGGGKNIRWDFIAQNLKIFTKKNPVVIIHGASTLRDTIGTQMNVPTQTFVSPSGISSVYTDKHALDIFLMAYAGIANKTIVACLLQHNIPAIGLTGVDGMLWQAKAKPDLFVKIGEKTRLIRNNLTGKVEKINTKLLLSLLKQKYVPVLTAPAITVTGTIVNTDNDWATAVTAGDLQIKQIVYLFEASGLLKNFNDPSSIISHVDKNALQDYLLYAHGRMKKKLLGAKEAFRRGVERIYFGDGRIENPIDSALSGRGTIIS
ncbi:acetylglutamate kinase [Candidatus Roizmanbacteria bacterium CG10_big_fil_rev_8_21_14_0_10_39_6]|uniref:Acetylglutamate kinase n=1 Tax=Candidatus Roizmanbacteria bacterium CG10_big_fil_rev_8_21_14_0_10_39_6 TaxID=1974853 RepID=A0A2M8KSZ0_9BACT|nr:MAG: acetylglutamate kinase [Candidatus Roizmanbacteria bacterium CG10_big_fil_rev_8_21_14_0_10_39_6]